MSIPLRFVRHQGPVLKGMGRGGALGAQAAAPASPSRRRRRWPGRGSTTSRWRHDRPSWCKPTCATSGGDGGRLSRARCPAAPVPAVGPSRSLARWLEGVQYPMLGGHERRLQAHHQRAACPPMSRSPSAASWCTSTMTGPGRAILDQKFVTGARARLPPRRWWRTCTSSFHSAPRQGSTKTTKARRPTATARRRTKARRGPGTHVSLAFWKLSGEAGPRLSPSSTGDFKPGPLGARVGSRPGPSKNVILHGLRHAGAGPSKGSIATSSPAMSTGLAEIDVRFHAAAGAAGAGRPVCAPAIKCGSGMRRGGPAYLEGTFKTRSRS